MQVDQPIRNTTRNINITSVQRDKFLKHDSTTKNNATLNKVITRFKNDNITSSNVSDQLKVEPPRTPRFFIKRKIYREGRPGSSVISCFSCHTSKIFQYAYFHLKPIVEQIPSYEKETTNVLNKLIRRNKICPS